MESISKKSPAALAFVGDAVYTLLTRERLTNKIGSFKELQELSAKLVSAAKQAEAYVKIEPFLNETEKEIFRHGRNHKTNNLPKNATASQYHIASGLECLFGHLYLTGEKDRIKQLFEIITQE